MPLSNVTIIFSPYHVGLRDHRVGNGPQRILSHNLVSSLTSLGLNVSTVEIPPVENDFEGEIGRSFEILRRTSTAVSNAVSKGEFPLVLSGNCMASVGVACGLGYDDLGFIYFDAHDDMDSPSTIVNGYFDSMGLSMLAGRSFEALMATVPGFRPERPARYDKFLYVGLRDVSDGQKRTVRDAGADVIYGGRRAGEVDYPAELREALGKREYGRALVHLDLDVLDESVGKVNGYESPGGLTGEELVECLGIVSKMVQPVSLTVCSFNPDVAGEGSRDGDTVARIAVKAITEFFGELVKR